MPYVVLGNVSVIEHWKPDPGSTATRVRSRKDLGHQETTFSLPAQSRDGFDFAGWIRTVESMWAMHSDESPAWIESDDATLRLVLANALGCPEGRPRDWRRGASHTTKSPERIDHKIKVT